MARSNKAKSDKSQPNADRPAGKGFKFEVASQSGSKQKASKGKAPKPSAKRAQSPGQTKAQERAARKKAKQASMVDAVVDKTKGKASGKKAKGEPATASRSVNTEASNYIPPEVSKRMIRRATWMAGLPSALGMSSFFINYYLLVNHILELPGWFTYTETLALFGLGFVGLSYGVLSASWEPERDGSWFGFAEFRFNVGILFQQWREYGDSKRGSSN